MENTKSFLNFEDFDNTEYDSKDNFVCSNSAATREDDDNLKRTRREKRTSSGIIFNCSYNEMIKTINCNRSFQSLIRDSITECDLLLKKLNRNPKKLSISNIPTINPLNNKKKNKIIPIERVNILYNPSIEAKAWSTMERHSLACAIRQQNEQMEMTMGRQDEKMLNLESEESCFEPNFLSLSPSQSQSHSPSQSQSQSPSQSPSPTNRTFTKQSKIAENSINNYGSLGLEYNLENINWEKIASYVNVRSNSMSIEKSSLDCRIQWTMIQHPLINKEKFGDTERNRLMKLESKGCHSWDDISRILQTNRTSIQCLSEWKRLKNEEDAVGKDLNLKRKWTPKEDEILKELVTIYGDTDSWIDISEMFTIYHPSFPSSYEGRSATSCRFRWEKSLNPQKRRGRWTEEEDEWLRVGIDIHGENPVGGWSLISDYLPNRTDVQCRERWLKVLDPSLLKEEWTPEEDSIFLKLITQTISHKGMHWSLIAKEKFPNRNDRQCRRRFLQLYKSNHK